MTTYSATVRVDGDMLHTSKPLTAPDEEIVQRLGLNGRTFVAGFDRPNITYRVDEKEDPRRQLRAFLDRHNAHMLKLAA